MIRFEDRTIHMFSNTSAIEAKVSNKKFMESKSRIITCNSYIKPDYS